jgi:hypothetical protein
VAEGGCSLLCCHLLCFCEMFVGLLHVDIYMCVCVCVCVCDYELDKLGGVKIHI